MAWDSIESKIPFSNALINVTHHCQTVLSEFLFEAASIFSHYRISSRSTLYESFGTQCQFRGGQSGSSIDLKSLTIPFNKLMFLWVIDQLCTQSTELRCQNPPHQWNTNQQSICAISLSQTKNRCYPESLTTKSMPNN